MSTKSRLRRRFAVVAATIVLPLSAILLVPVAGFADEEPKPPKPKGPILRTDGTICWEKRGPSERPSITVHISPAWKDKITVIVDTTDGTAVAPDDYAPAKGLVLTIPAGAKSVQVPLDIVNDGKDEPDEWFTVRLSKPSVGEIDKKSDGLVIIKDGSEPEEGK
jgi:hypothetical protein